MQTGGASTSGPAPSPQPSNSRMPSTPAFTPHMSTMPPPSYSAGSSAKRGRGRPMPGTGGSSSAFKAAEITPAARRKKQKVAEKMIPAKVAAMCPESAIYTQLLEFEARVDKALTRKKLDVQEVVRTPPTVNRTLRMYVFNTYANQTQNHSTGGDNNQGQNNVHEQLRNPGEPPSWTLRVMGRVVEPEDRDPEGNAKPNPSLPKFSSFFKRITIQLDPRLYPDNHSIVWDGARAVNHVEGFEIKRRGDTEFVVSVRLELDYGPDRFKLSPALAGLLGVEVDTRPRIIAALWQYIKGKKLQNPADPTLINCDAALQKVLGEERIKFVSVAQRLHQHLSPPQPIHIEHRIKLSGRNPVGNACYDVAVTVPSPLQKEMTTFLANIENHRDIDMFDHSITSSIRKINEHRRRRAFFLGFCQSPAEFINGLIASQSRDLKMVVGHASRNSEKERRSDFYHQPWVEDAVIRYMNRRPGKTSDSAGNT